MPFLPDSVLPTTNEEIINSRRIYIIQLYVWLSCLCYAMLHCLCILLIYTMNRVSSVSYTTKDVPLYEARAIDLAIDSLTSFNIHLK